MDPIVRAQSFEGADHAGACGAQIQVDAGVAFGQVRASHDTVKVGQVSFHHRCVTMDDKSRAGRLALVPPSSASSGTARGWCSNAQAQA